MSGIIEIWRKNRGDSLPVRYTIGSPAALPNSEIPAGPIVAHIDYRESGAMAGKRLAGPVFCITFEDSFVQRFIPAKEVIDVGYETQKADVTKAPAMEA